MRGSLLYRTIVQCIALVVAIFATGTSAFAADWTDSTDSKITYTALKTIKGDGSAYVITDIVPTLTDVVKMRFKTRNAKLNVNETLFCARQGFKNKSFGAMIANSGKLRIDRGNQTEQYSSSALAKNAEYLMSVNYGDGSKNTTVTTNGSAFALAGDLVATSDNPTSGLVLFALNNNTTILSGYGGQHYLYYFELYDSSGNLKNCLMPAKCDSDSVVGLYDTKSGRFYPQAGGTFTTAARTVTGQGAKWIGRGGDNKMSTAANWEGGNVPQEGDNLDFTLAPPLAELVADIDATFGKVWLSDGDMPGFTGALTARAVNNLSKMQNYDTSTASFTFTLAAPIGEEFIWNGTGTNWGDADAWTYDNASATWSDHNNAIFNIANATATLADNAIASSVVFRADAAIASGGGTLAVPKIVVSNGVSAVVNAPIDGMFVKSGAGTLTLGASRAATTHILEGTFKMAPGATLSTSYQLQLGTDEPSRPVTFDYGGQTYTKDMEYYLVTGSSVTLTNGVYVSEHSSQRRGMRISEETVIPSSLVILDSVVRVGDKDFNFGYGTTLSGDSLPDEPKSILAATNTIFNVVGAFRIGRDGVTEGKTAGFYKADFDSCVITTSYFIVNNDRPLNNARLNNVRLVAKTADSAVMARDGDTKWITVGPDGLTLDTNTGGWNLYANLGGSGVVTKVGAGILEIVTNQTGTAALNVNEGSIVPRIGVSVERPVTVASNAVLGVYGSVQSSFSNVTFASGATFNVLSYYYGVTPVRFGSLTFPEENGAVVLKLDGGAFPKGVYAIYERNGVTAAEGEKFAVETADDLPYTWSVVDDRLLLTVGELSGNFWTGLGDGVSMSDGANWLSGSAPAAGSAVDFSGISFNTTINADTGVTYGTVTMGSGTITFTNALAATNFTDTSKISVGADSTVTIVGNLEISGEGDRDIVYTIAEGGKFVVTGDIIATEAFAGANLYPSTTAACPGKFVARGLANRGTGGRSFRLARNSGGSHVTWVIGDHGISSTGTAGFWVFNKGNTSATIIADADFTISASIANREKLYFSTTGTDGEAHTITVGDGTTGLLDNDGWVGLYGSGKVLFNSISTTSGGLAVHDTATLAVNPGCQPCNRLVHVYTGAGLEIAQSGTVELADNLQLDDGTTLAFNFTDRSTVPTLALAEGKSVVFTEGASTNIAVKVSGTHPRGGEKILTTCGGFNTDGVNVSLAEDVPNWVNGLSVNGDGNIVLSVKPMAMLIIVR